MGIAFVIGGKLKGDTKGSSQGIALSNELIHHNPSVGLASSSPDSFSFQLSVLGGLANPDVIAVDAFLKAGNLVIIKLQGSFDCSDLGGGDFVCHRWWEGQHYRQMMCYLSSPKSKLF